jgi:hypothetical protein
MKTIARGILEWKCLCVKSSVGDPDPEPDPKVLGHLGSGSISQKYGSGSSPFLIKVLSGLKG